MMLIQQQTRIQEVMRWMQRQRKGTLAITTGAGGPRSVQPIYDGVNISMIMVIT